MAERVWRVNRVESFNPPHDCITTPDKTLIYIPIWSPEDEERARFIADACNEKEQRARAGEEWTQGIFLRQPFERWYALDAAMKAQDIGIADAVEIIRNAHVRVPE